MIFNMEKLKEQAHHSALKHDPFVSRKSSKQFWKNNERNAQKLRDFVAVLHENKTSCTQPAEEWLLDHAEFIEEQMVVIKHELEKSFVKKLPHLSKTGETRIIAICDDYLRATDGHLKMDTFLSFIRSYQEVSVLTLAEAWAMPLMMRVALIRHLAEMMDVIKERHDVCTQVEKMLSGIETSDITAEKLKQVLEDAGYEMPLSGPMIVHLVKHLRERTDYSPTVGEWLLCKLENGRESLDHILSYEYQLQANYQVTTGNLISSLRNLSRWDWRETFEEISAVEQTLRKEKLGCYAKMDFSSRETLRNRVEKLAQRFRLPENLIAAQAVEAADEAAEILPAEEPAAPPRNAFVSYYLLEPDGLQTLRQRLKACGNPRSLPKISLLRRNPKTYFNMMAVFLIVFMVCFTAFVAWDQLLTPLELLIIAMLLLLPAMEWSVSLVHFIIERIKQPTPLLRYDFSGGIPDNAATMVVIPVIWSTKEEVEELLDRLELHYLANRDKNLHFALLGDLKDADKQRLIEDEIVTDAAVAGIRRLNRSYPDQAFYLFQRKRLWNPSEKIWMGWERKRGKLVEFVELVKGHEDTSYNIVEGDVSSLREIRYIITLDADTQLPLESAQRMVGTLHLPFNRPRLNEAETRVTEGYGVLQPRIGMSHESAMRSRFAALWSSAPGVDPYAFAISDPYQDNFGQGIFTGKGIFDVDMFYKVLCERIPENRLLSHDLLEGGFLRAGLLSDIELIDGHPSRFSAYQKRLHRWVRGDWQLLLWLLPKVKNRRGEAIPVDLSILTRWQIIDNLRRSLLTPVLFAILLLAAAVLPGYPLRWFAIAFATLCIPVLRQLIQIKAVSSRLRSIGNTAAQVVISILTLPFQAVLLSDAIVRTLYRMLFSKQRLLEWVPAADVDRDSKQKGAPVLYGVYGGYSLVLLYLAAAVLTENTSILAVAIASSLVWASAIPVIRWLDKPVEKKEVHFSSVEEEDMRKLSQEIWTFYEDYVAKEDNWLPPDNVQFEPPNGVAHRTSPTNIGLYLTCALAARDFDFIDTRGFIERLERTLTTVERLEKWNGHLYNWYDTQTLQPLHPKYISTVDSGNFVVCLITAREGVLEWLQSLEEPESDDSKERQYDESLHIAFSEELTPLETEKKPTEVGETWYERGQRLLSRLDRIIEDTDFRPLYNHKTKLFYLGYHAERHQHDEVLYDLMASEARQASFVAIALGQVSVSHWNALGRTMTKVGKKPLLLSWSGTMFEYLMPWLFLRTYKNTLWETTYKTVVDRQMDYAEQRGVPFGISESGYYAFDYQMNYQYRAFGVPGLGFKRGLEQDLVIAPYATILALPFAKQQGLEAMKKIEQLDGRGKYGFYEAIDFTRERLPKGRKHATIFSYMAHHQGMSMLTLANLLLPKKMYSRFHRNKQVRSAELLLQERIPEKAKMIKHPAITRTHEPYSDRVEGRSAIREYQSVETRTPEVCVLSNGKLTTVVTNSGSGFSRYDGLAVSRWREDPVMDSWGSYVYIYDTSKDKLWSPSYQPCRVKAEQQRVQFALHKATFLREDGDVKTSMEVCVSPEWNAEIRRISLTNTGEKRKVLEVTTFVELALANPIADDAHPAFSKLFIRTAFDAEAGCLVAGRRPREANDKTLWAAHSLMIENHTLGTVEYETDRSSFIGRGYKLSKPQGINSRLRGKVGSVADPAFVMRRRVTVDPGEQIQLVAITSVAETREEAVDIIHRAVPGQTVERTYQLAWNRAEIELRNLHLSRREAAGFHLFAGHVLYTPPFRRERETSIQVNQKGQSSLWAYGVSGDRPIVLVRINDQNRLPFVVKLLTGHEYLRRLGIFFDLVVLNESEEGYQQHLQEALQRTSEQGIDRFGEGVSGVYVIAANQLPDEDKALLAAVARMEFRAEGPSFYRQLQVRGKNNAMPLPDVLVPEPVRSEEGGSGVSTVAEEQEDGSKKWLFFNGWGGFSPDGKEYWIQIKNGNHLPSPWINVIANRQFGCLVSELGTGYTWWQNSRECKLTPWSNDPVLDPPTETGYIRDEASGEVWSLGPSTAKEKAVYQVVHGRGYSRFEHERKGLKHEMTIYVPLDDPVKIIRLKLKNKTKQKRRISLTYYAEWVLGVQRQANAPYIVTKWLPEAQILTATNTYQETFRDATAFLGIFSSDEVGQEQSRELTWTGDRREFIGRNGSMADPAALSRISLSGRTGACYDSCGAVQRKLILEPGQEQALYILLGCDQSTEAVVGLTKKYRQPSACEAALNQVTEFWERHLDQINVSTPSPEMDLMLNGWLLYQSLACRMWARSAFYQAGGAYGFRDQLQDSLALLHTLPEMMREQIIRHASHQYLEGDVQHWWHEETERGIRTLFSDDLLWLPYCVSRYIEHTGDRTVLEETAPYLYSEPLREEEHERYEPTVLASESGSVYEHCLRAIDKALSRIGEHGLPLIGVGDWNDGMNLVGAEGRGESVWLAWFLCDVLQRFSVICHDQGDSEKETSYLQMKEKLVSAVNDHGWDGQWYRRAFTDSGQWLGSIQNEECRIDAIAQAWSVISNGAPQERALQAMQSFDRELVDRELSVIRLLTPAFDQTEPSPGYIQGYPPGIRENGAQYTHGVIWGIVAWCQLGQGEKALEMFTMINPLTHTRTDHEVRQYTGEPYVMAADVYTAEPHEGHAGWTWYTGASGWMYQAGLEWILGVRRRGGQLHIDPCIPNDWPEYSVTYRYGNTKYHVTVKNHSGAPDDVKKLSVDGKEVPLSEAGALVPLEDGGVDRYVEVLL
ncbi:Cellobiose phosphorylase [Evansella caseinilytica]|uniref:Cellobiose phosphorylase n=1 Tax=Evansella caseinilytica TaxID=1503961 RepID=A0A1H3GNM5_9BACI|nr:glucoamylase family protein [Evansella caseinilytica]SDY04575.1 Cellobiose phosphorylase [Evansella caseinilytica]